MVINIILEFIKIIFTWPIIVFILVLVFLLKYHGSISYFIEHIKSVKYPGGEITQNEVKKEPPIGKPEEKRDVIKLTEELTQVKVNHEERDRLLEEAKVLIPQLANGMQFYKFEYLDLFYVPNTKAVLDWLNSNTQVTTEYYKLLWGPVIKNAIQVEITLSVLLSYDMIKYIGNSITITDEGIRFLAYLKDKYKIK